VGLFEGGGHVERGLHTRGDGEAVNRNARRGGHDG